MRYLINTIVLAAYIAFNPLAIAQGKYPQCGKDGVFHPKFPVIHMPYAGTEANQCPGSFAVVVTDQAGKDSLDCYASEQDYWDYMESSCSVLAVSRLSIF